MARRRYVPSIRILTALLVAAAVTMWSLPGYASPPEAPAGPPPLTPAELIAEAKTLAGRHTTMQGEVIGPVLLRGANAWINVGFDGTVIGVWVRADLASAIQYCGGYRVKGDTVRVEGILFAACAEHGGELDYHAESLAVVAVGGPAAPRRVTSWLLGVTALALGALLLGVALVREKRQPTP